MPRAVALIASLSLLGCFPHNPRARTYAKLGEGAAILAGIGISAFANTTADCDLMDQPGIGDTNCRSGAKWLSTAGVVLVVGGLLGFVATVSTAEAAAKAPPAPLETATKPAAGPPTKPADKGTASDAGSAAPNGSAAPAPPAPSTPR